MVLRPIAIVLLAVSPVAAQDFLAPLQELVNELVLKPVPPEKTSPPMPEQVSGEPTSASERPTEVDEDGAPPLPRPRPEAIDQHPAADALEVEDQQLEPENGTPVPEPAATDAVEEDAPATPDRVYQSACPALLSGLVVGEMLSPIEDGICGERSPLLMSAVRVNGREVALSSPLTTNCAMAGTLAEWVSQLDRYASAALDAPLSSVTTGTSYFCRNRNGAETGFVSEHGFANAVDVTGFVLQDGRQVNVEADWLPQSSPESKLLHHAHGTACGGFTTVLGPEANEEHEDHFHLDLGCHGQSCTAQICE